MSEAEVDQAVNNILRHTGDTIYSVRWSSVVTREEEINGIQKSQPFWSLNARTLLIGRPALVVSFVNKNHLNEQIGSLGRWGWQHCISWMGFLGMEV